MDTTTPTDRAVNLDHDLDRSVTQRHSLKTRHATALSKLMAEREDLRGTYAFADFVADAVRWSA